jgi:hypothetical protein
MNRSFGYSVKSQSYGFHAHRDELNATSRKMADLIIKELHKKPFDNVGGTMINFDDFAAKEISEIIQGSFNKNNGDWYLSILQEYKKYIDAHLANKQAELKIFKEQLEQLKEKHSKFVALPEAEQEKVIQEEITTNKKIMTNLIAEKEEQADYLREQTEKAKIATENDYQNTINRQILNVFEKYLPSLRLIISKNKGTLNKLIEDTADIKKAIARKVKALEEDISYLEGELIPKAEEAIENTQAIKNSLETKAT